MKKMKKSLKIILALVSVAVVAIATTVITILLVNNNKRKNNPSNSDYALTAEQKLLVNEINNTANTAVSNGKLHAVEFDSEFIDLRNVSYIDKHTMWVEDRGSYIVEVFDEAGVPCMLRDVLWVNGVIASSDIIEVVFANKNHFVVLVSGGEILICSVENSVPIEHKRYDVDTSSDEWKHNGNNFVIRATDTFFAVLLSGSNGYYYEFYEYLNNYSGYSSYRYSIDGIEYADAYAEGKDFSVNGEIVVTYIDGSGFSLYQSNDLVENWVLEKGLISQTKTVHNSKVSGAHLDEGKYYTYSYTLTANGKTTQINLDSYNKLSGIMYSGEKYFAVFMQKVNDAGQLVEGGQAVYFDYDLNVVAKYEASSHASRIYYAENANILTGDGIFSTKNQVELQKMSNFGNLGFEFYRMMSNGKFILKNSFDSLIIYNFKLEQIYQASFDLLIRMVDDDNYIFQKQGEYYLYSLSKNTAEKINYVDNYLLSNTSMYLVQNEDSYLLYDGARLFKDNVLSVVDSGNNTLELYLDDGTQLNYCLVENADNLPVLALNVSYNPDPVFDEPEYSAVLTPNGLYYPDAYGNVGEQYIEPDWYDYDDKILRGIASATDSSFTITAMHCIDKGYYSKISYRDYFEFAYAGQDKDNVSTYKPLRFYYTVSVDNEGKPKVNSVSMGHHFLMAGSQSGAYASNHYVTSAGIYLKDGAKATDQFGNYSYDQKNAGGKYYYIYTGGLNVDGTGFAFDTSGSKAEVYGNSIRITLKFTFKQFSTYSVDFSNCKFGQSKINDSDVQWSSAGVSIPNIGEPTYYNNLYYQTIVIGYKAPDTGSTLNAGINYYSDVINKATSGGDSSTNITPATNYFSGTQLSGMLTGATESSLFQETIVQETAIQPTEFNATVSNKITYSTTYSPLYVGNVALDIAGGRLIGFTNFDATAYNSINYSFLYDNSRRTYDEDRLKYRAHGVDSSTDTSAFDVIDYEYLTYDKTNGIYVLNYKNADELYHSGGGLNKYRYVYCIYEPMTYHMELDYNVGALDDENAGLSNEIDYLKKYAGLSVGVEGTGDYINYNELWAYNVPEVDDAGNPFADYTGDHKYATKDFTDNYTRLGEGSEDFVEKEETIGFSITSSGGKYYSYPSFQIRDVNTYVYYEYYFMIPKPENMSTGGGEEYQSLPREDNKIYLIASRVQSDISALIPGSGSAYYYSDPLGKTDYENYSGYAYGDRYVYICIDFSDDVDGIVYYREKNISTASAFEMYSPIQEYKSAGETLDYISIGGERYFLQRNYTDGSTAYLTDYKSKSSEGFLYLKAYRDIGDFRALSPVPDYGNFVVSSDNNYKSSVFEAGDSYVEICIKFDLSFSRAYFFMKNSHERTASYTGHYYYEGDDAVEDTDTSKTYSVSEQFTFLYTDDIKFFADPVHTHYIFAGWKVLAGDLTSYVNYEDKTGVFTPNYIGDSKIQLINPVDGRYLAGSLATYSSLWGDLLTVVGSDGNITWKSASDIADSPITLLAQWKPALCSVDVTLWTQESSDDPHMAVVRQESGELAIGPLTDKDTKPEFTVGGTSIDANKDGKLDVTINFYYSSTKNYDSIYTDISSYYLLESINATGMEWKLAGWSYKDGDTYFAIMGSSETIAEFIGDTTKLSINAYYSEANYDIEISLNPMGGAQHADGSKDFVGSGSDSSLDIYNDETSFARYNVHVSNNLDGTLTSGFSRYYLNDSSSITGTDMVITDGSVYNKLTLLNEQTKYQISLLGGAFIVGENIAITIEEATEKYYVKRLTFKNVTLYNDYGKFDKYTIVFEYNHYTSGTLSDSGWNVTVTSQTDASQSLAVSSSSAGGVVSLKIGSQDYNKKYNNEKNIFSIANSPSGKGIVVSVTRLSNPGTIVSGADNKLNGTQGFSMECVLESYAIRNETVVASEKLNDEAPSDENSTPTIHFNKSIMTSAQLLSSIEGKELERDKPAFVWLGTQRYLFSKKWQDISSYPTGYYMIYTGDQQEAEYRVDCTYELFISQPLVKDTNLMVYYDNTNGLIYYPTQTNVNVVETTGKIVTEYGGSDEPWYNFYVMIHGKKFFYCTRAYISSNGLADALFASGAYSGIVFKDVYIKLDVFGGVKPSVSQKVTTSTEEEYNADNNFYEDGETEELVVHLTPNGNVTYKTNNGQTSLYAGYNNTRVIAIDPEQENVRFSASPDSAYTDTTRYELKYYISKLTIGDTFYEFDKPTRDIVWQGDFYTYGWLNLNIKSGDSSYTGEGKIFRYMGVDYYIQDAYKWTLSADPNRLGANEYYFYLTRDENGFTRYFLIFDEEEEDQGKNSGNYVNIDVEFSRFLNKLEINVTEEDLYHQGYYTVSGEGSDSDSHYNVIQKSFGVSYNDNISSSRNYSWNEWHHDNSRKSYEYMKTLTPIDSEKMQDRVFYESVGYQDDGITPNAIVNDKIALLENLGDVPTLKWSALTKFYPCDTNRLNFTANSGYIIKSFTITFGLGNSPDDASGTTNYVKIISFELDESSFERMNYLSLTGQYSYLDPTNSTPLLKYKISGTEATTIFSGHTDVQNIGLNILPEIRTGSTGLMYGVMEKDSWNTKSEDYYTIDDIFVLLSGLYGNVRIDMTTTSYSEYLFESNEEDVNALIKDPDDVKSDGSGNAYKYLEAEVDTNLGYVVESVLTQKTYLDLYTQKLNSSDSSKWDYDLLSTGIDPASYYTSTELSDKGLTAPSSVDGFTTGKMIDGTPTSTQNYIGDKYKVQYYFENDSASGIKQGTIRIIFCGTVSRIKGGLHFMASHNDYSVYFTNGKYYNQASYEIKNASSAPNDAFVNLADYSGRSGDDKIIDQNTTFKELEVSNGIINETTQIGTNNFGGISMPIYGESRYVVIEGVKYYFVKNRDLNEGRPYLNLIDVDRFTYNYSYFPVVKEESITNTYYPNTATNDGTAYASSYYKKGCYSFIIYVDKTIENTTSFKYRVINSDTSEPLSYSNKMVYMSTGPLALRDEVKSHFADHEVKYYGYFDKNKANFASFDSLYNLDGIESNYKYFVSMIAVKNTITLETSSYLYDKTVDSGTYSAGSVSDYNNTLTYNFIDETKLAFSGQNVYQLDNTSKEDSWFNDTILTNMQFNSYMDEYDGSGNMTSNPKTWVNRDAVHSNRSELTTLEMEGYDFNWTYYTIAGYKLQYIMVYLVDFKCYMVIDVVKLSQNLKPIDDDGNALGSFVVANKTPSSSDGRNYDFNFKLEFYKDINPVNNNLGEDIGGTVDSEGTCYKFYPTIFENDDSSTQSYDKENALINKLRSVNIMSNSIKVAFISESYSYQIQYNTHKNATESNSNLTNAIDDVSSYPGYTGGTGTSYIRTQTFRYDCMTTLSCSMSLNGYTFIGWGSEKYFNGTEYVSRYQSKVVDGSGNITSPVTWNTSSSWYDPTQFFVKSKDDSGAYVSAYQSALNSYNYFKNHNDYVSPGDPCKAFYVDGAYFVTDTGYKSGYEAQNYNFYGDYAEIFNFHLINKLHSGATMAGNIVPGAINLFAIFKANVYTIHFAVNNDIGDAYYLSFEEKILLDIAGNTETKDSDWLTTTFVNNSFGIQTTNAGKNRTYYAYVTFDTNNWYYSENNGQSLQYAYKFENTYDIDGSGNAYYTNPYVITEITKDNDLSRLSVDMFGYSWLGWYYKDHALINENQTIDNSHHVLQSFYNPVSGTYVLPSLDNTFHTTLKDAGALSDVNTGTFVYNGQHKANEKRKVNLYDGLFDNYEFDVYDSSTGVYRLKYSDRFYYFQVPTGSSTIGQYYKLFTTSSMTATSYVSNMYVSVYSENSSNKPQKLYLYISKASAIDGYVYFYDYSSTGKGNVNNTYIKGTDWCGVPNFSYTLASDTLNKCYWDDASRSFAYSKKFVSNIVFSYFDTSLSASAYQVTGSQGEYYLNLNRVAANIRYIKLFANWVNNAYEILFEFLDSTTSFDPIGSSQATTTGYSSGGTHYFNSTTLSTYLWNETKQLPYRVGYDFVGWTFSYIYSKGIYADALYDLIYQPSAELNLNYKLFSPYAVLNSLPGKDPYESNIFMWVEDRLYDSEGNSQAYDEWILNESGKAEHLGDTEGKRTSDVKRYLYIFPVWRVQTFSVGISMNVSQEELQNLYEKDSNFALGLYNSAVHSDYTVNDGKTTNYTGVASKFYTFNTTSTGTPSSANKYSSYQNYFNDIVANIYFEIEFDKPIDTARLSFGGRIYYLKDLFMTSAGYYFLGLMYQQDDKGSSYFVQNTLKSVLELGSDNITYVKHEDSSGGITYDNSSGIAKIFDYNMYLQVYRSNFDGDSIQSGGKNISSDLDKKNVNGASTNFGSIRYNSKDYYIKSEQVGLEYYLYVLIGNRKYYIAFYEDDSGTKKSTISFDRTFMYYLDRDANGNLLNTYILKYDNSGNLYYVKDSFTNRIYPNVKMAVYEVARNTYDFTGNDKEFASVTTKSMYTTREFTLYAHWEIKQNISSTIVNGNNGVGGDSDNSNPGLAGWYSIDSSTHTDNQTEAQKTKDHEFYSTVAYEFLPFYNGRYISELMIEFDSFVEVSSGITSRFERVHNSLVLRFTFTSSTHDLAITEVLWNGVNFTSSMLGGTATNSKYNSFRNIPELSLIDYYNMNQTYSNSSAVYIYDYDKGTKHDRKNISPVTLKLNNLMTSVKFTCKFSVQTYQVEVYSVVVGSSILKTNGSKYSVEFSSIESMWNASNKVTSNRGAYGNPYISNLNYNSTIASTISTNTALQTMSYNVPYYYFLSSTDNTGELLDGLAYIYGSSYTYKSGTTGTNVAKTNNTLASLKKQINDRGYQSYATKFNDVGGVGSAEWFTFDSEGENKLFLNEYSVGTTPQPIMEDKTIYGFFVEENTANKQVKFYYWDNDKGQYVQYLNNENDYKAGVGSKITESGGKYYITELPSPSIAPWYGSVNADEANKKFIGYVVIDEAVLADMKESSIDYNYRSQLLDQKTSYTDTTGDLASHLHYYRGSVGSDFAKDLLHVTDLFNYRITVVDNKKYYVKNNNILDAVRVNMNLNTPYGQITVQKDLKMLNVDYELGEDITYAIPLYEDVVFEFVGYSFNSASKVLTINSTTDMVRSNVFELNSKYTIFFDPADARIAISSSTNPSLSTINGYAKDGEGMNFLEFSSASKWTDFKEETRIFGGESYTFGQKQLKSTVSTNYRIYLYYVDNAGKAFYKTSNYISLSSSNASCTGVSNINPEVISPLEVALTSSSITTYNRAVSEVDAGCSLEEATNRKLVVYILLQLLDSKVVEIYDNTNSIYYSSDYTDLGTDVGQLSVSIEEIIKAINEKAVYGRDGIQNRVTNLFGLYRMAYSIAYHFVSTTGYNGGNTIGLRALYGKGEEAGKTQNGLSYANINTIMSEHFMDVGTYNLLPGDFLKDDKTKAGAVAVRDVAKPETHYSYTTVEIDEDDDSLVQLSMLLYCTRDSSGAINSVAFLKPTINADGTITLSVQNPSYKFDRLYQDYEKYDRYKFEFATSTSPGLYELDPLANDATPEYFFGISSSTSSYADPANNNSTEDSTQISRTLYMIRGDHRNSIYYVKTTYTDKYYYLKESYEQAVTSAKSEVSTAAGNAVRSEALNYAKVQADKWVQTTAVEFLTNRWNNFTDEEKKTYGDNFENFVALNYKTYEDMLTGNTDYQKIQSDAYYEKYNALYQAKYDELFPTYFANKLKGLTTYEYDTSNYNASSKTGYVTLSGGGESNTFYYYDLNNIDYFYYIKDPNVTDETKLDDRYVVKERSGYDENAYWLRISNRTNITENANNYNTFIFTRYESFFTSDWNDSP